jgi:hypothetical protein
MLFFSISPLLYSLIIRVEIKPLHDQRMSRREYRFR